MNASMPGPLTETVRRPMVPMAKDSFLAVRITAADFNGKEFDGAPLVGTTNGIDDVHAIIPMLEAAKVQVEARGSTDYAWFGVQDEYHNTHWAGPGDYIVSMKPGQLLVVPGPFFEFYLRSVS